MERETGYYWIRQSDQSPWSVGYWTMGMWVVGVVMVHPVEIDERRIVRGHQRRVRKLSQRDVDLTARVLRGDKMTELAKLYGLSSTRVRQIAWRTLQKRNPTLYETLTPADPNLRTPTVFDMRKHAAAFGFSVQPDGTVDTSKEG